MHDRLGKFQILRMLGKGAMGEVYLAHDTVLGRDVAIKTIQAGSAFGEEAKARFEREARVTGVLNHPNIVTVYEFGLADGVHYLVMEYVEGEDLEGLIQKRSLGKVEFLEILAQVCDGLSFAHEHNVIHRDIKPANVLVGIRGRRTQAKLMDFGVALVDRSNLTQQGIWMGTVNYMAPEYLDTGKATPGSDLFAVGVMLYEVVTGGRKPFGGETMTTILNAILREAPAPFRPEDVQDVSPEVQALVRKALAKHPAERFATADELADAIRDAARTLGTARRSAPAPAPVPVAAPVVTPSGTVVASGPTRKDPSDRMLVVGRGGRATCLSIRVALRQSEANNSILVLPGQYRETLVLEKDTIIRAEGDPGTVILEGSGGPVLTVKHAQVVLEGFTLRRQGTSGSPLIDVGDGTLTLRGCRLEAGEDPGLEVRGGQGKLILEQCQIDGVGFVGCQILDGADLQASQCTWSGFSRCAIRTQGPGEARLEGNRFDPGVGVAVWAQGPGQVTLEGCQVLQREAGGLEVEGPARLVMRGGCISGSRFAGLLALAKAHVTLEDVAINGHDASGLHAEGGSLLMGKGVQFSNNGGFGLSLLSGSSATLDGCDLAQNQGPGLFLHQGAMAQLKGCHLRDGQSLGVVCATGGKGVLEACDISGNAQSGAQVEPGGSLLLVRCTLRDGRDTGLLLFEDAEATLEECVVHRNARGGILLAKDASDPVIRGANQIEDDLLRATPQGNLVKLAPLKKR